MARAYMMMRESPARDRLAGKFPDLQDRRGVVPRQRRGRVTASEGELQQASDDSRLIQAGSAPLDPPAPSNPPSPTAPPAPSAAAGTSAALARLASRGAGGSGVD